MPWTCEDSAAAMAEGWDVFDSDGELMLQRLDDPQDAQGEPLEPPFPGDGEAWAHVVERARAGSRLHRRALLDVSEAERGRIAQHCGDLTFL